MDNLIEDFVLLDIDNQRYSLIQVLDSLYALGPADPSTGLMPEQAVYSVGTRISVQSPYLSSGVSLTNTWTLTLKNPCIDPNFVTIIPTSQLDPLEYFVGSGESTYEHGEFVVETSPDLHDLCGTVSTEGFLNQVPVSELGGDGTPTVNLSLGRTAEAPLEYYPDSRLFLSDTDDVQFVD